MPQSTINSSYDEDVQSAVGGGTDWATIRAGNGTAVTTNGFGLRLQVSGGLFFTMSRMLFIFDTSSIPDNATINSATFSLYITGKTDFVGNNGSIRFVKGTTATNSAIVASDFQGKISNTTNNATADKTIASVTTSAYNDFTLNATGLANISLVGVSKFGLKWTNDADNSSPGTSDQDPFINWTNTAGANPPKLVINYAVPGGGGFLNNFI